MSDSLLRMVFPRDVHHVEGLHATIGGSIPERGRILDLGCGSNSELGRYRTRTREVWGADFQPHPKLQNPGWFVQLENDGRIPFPDGYFDTVVTVMVLEHIVDPHFFLSEVSRVLRPSGRFIGHSISGMHYVTFMSRIIGLLPHGIKQAIVKKLYHRHEVDTFPTCYRMNNARQLFRYFEDTGFVCADFNRYADPGYFRFSKPIQTAAILTDKLLDGIFPGSGRLYFTVVAEKPPTSKAKPVLPTRRNKSRAPATNRTVEAVQ